MQKVYIESEPQPKPLNHKPEPQSTQSTQRQIKEERTEHQKQNLTMENSVAEPQLKTLEPQRSRRAGTANPVSGDPHEETPIKTAEDLLDFALAGAPLGSLSVLCG
jgi:queuine/archaeosine tRNA-ribosyltransferase